MKFDIKDKYEGEVIFTADIECDKGESESVKLGLAVAEAHKMGANLEGADLERAYLNNANLRGANLEGADLEGADLERAYLNNANLRGAYLREARLKGACLMVANLRWASLIDADLSSADLRRAYLNNANLRGANLEGADLNGADLERSDFSGARLRGARMIGVPAIKDIHQTVYAAASRPGALEMADWHTCETTHCRAGWVVVLAGEEGKRLEDRIGTGAAAAFIYFKSDPDIKRVPAFFANNTNALSDMKELADAERSEGVRR